MDTENSQTLEKLGTGSGNRTRTGQAPRDFRYSVYTFSLNLASSKVFEMPIQQLVLIQLAFPPNTSKLPRFLCMITQGLHIVFR